LDLAAEALKMMFDLDRSATRGEMSARALVAFEHSSPLGSAPASALLDRVGVERREQSRPARSFADYSVSIDEKQMPAGVTIHRLL
jgi:CRISPR-associated protein Csd2